MKSRSIGLFFGIGAVVSAAWMMPACSDDTDTTTGASTSVSSSSSSSGTGGTGGGSSSSSSSVSSSSGVMTTMCGSETCEAVNVLGAIDLAACCPASNPMVCGLDISPVASFVMLPPGCLELNRPGAMDPSCPTQMLDIMGMMVTLPGCCGAGMCGSYADFSGFAMGLNFGCVDTTAMFTDGGMPAACGGGTGGSGTGGTGGTGSGAGGAGGGAGGSGGTGG